MSSIDRIVDNIDIESIKQVISYPQISSKAPINTINARVLQLMYFFSSGDYTSLDVVDISNTKEYLHRVRSRNDIQKNKGLVEQLKLCKERFKFYMRRYSEMYNNQ